MGRQNLLAARKEWSIDPDVEAWPIGGHYDLQRLRSEDDPTPFWALSSSNGDGITLSLREMTDLLDSIEYSLGQYVKEVDDNL